MEEFVEKYGHSSLTNFDIYDIVKKLKIPNFRGVFMRDRLSKRPHKHECGIMNFNTSNQSGSHWVAWFKNGSNRIYFDSFGCITPDELQRYMKTKREYKDNILCIHRNTDQIQKANTQICGQICLYILKELSAGRKYQDILYT